MSNPQEKGGLVTWLPSVPLHFGSQLRLPEAYEGQYIDQAVDLALPNPTTKPKRVIFSV